MAAFLDAPPRSPEERKRRQYELAQRYHQITPGSAAEDELAREYLPLVRSIVQRIAMTLPAHVDSNDLYSSGLVGLLNAIRNYDPTSGSTFESYARVRIRGAIFDELRRLDWVPRTVHDKARKVQAVIAELEQKRGELPSDAEVAKALNLTEAEYEELLEEIRPAAFVCLDSAQCPDDETRGSRHETIGDGSLPGPDENVSHRELAAIIAERIPKLPETQRKVLALYYAEGYLLREIAEMFGVTQSRICQIHTQAIMSIRAYLNRYESRGQ